MLFQLYIHTSCNNLTENSASNIDIGLSMTMIIMEGLKRHLLKGLGIYLFYSVRDFKTYVSRITIRLY